MRKRVYAVVSALVVIPLLAGCIMGNWQKDVKPTVGQELLDLKAARDKGALSEHEYNEQKVAILNRDRGEATHAIASDPQSTTTFR